METEDRFSDLLYRRRSLFVGEDDIQAKTCQTFRRRLLELATESAESIRIIIDSSGGDAASAMQCYDLLRALPVRTIGIAAGRCNSAAILILQGCTERIAFPHTRLLVHSAKVRVSDYIANDAEGNYASFRASLEFLDQAQKCQERILRSRSGMTLKKLRKLMEAGDYHDTSLTAPEALRLGLLDRIVTCMFPPTEPD